MLKTIYRGNHKPWPLNWPGLRFCKKGRTIISRKVLFTESCKYDLPGTEDDEDVNKLFGIGYFPNHHKESARVGWRYCSKNDKIEILSYCYISGQRMFKNIGYAEIDTFYTISIRIDENDKVYRFKLEKNEKPVVYNYSSYIVDDTVPFTHKKKINYRLGLFFGGNQPSPHNISIIISK